MARELEKLVDFKILESDAQKACEGEKLYWIRNDAKLRAATGKPIEYEEFRKLLREMHNFAYLSSFICGHFKNPQCRKMDRQIVDAAHLKPLERKDAIRPSDMKTVWNPFCQRKESYRN